MEEPSFILSMTDIFVIFLFQCNDANVLSFLHQNFYFPCKILHTLKQMKVCTTDYIFAIKQDNICDYNPLCFMSSGLMLDNIIMNIFTKSTKKSTKPHQKYFFPRIQDDTIYLYMQDFTRKRKIPIQKGHYVRIITLKLKN